MMLGTAEAKPEGALNRLDGVKDVKASYPDETVRPASSLSRHRRVKARRIQLDSLSFVW